MWVGEMYLPRIPWQVFLLKGWAETSCMPVGGEFLAPYCKNDAERFLQAAPTKVGALTSLATWRSKKKSWFSMSFPIYILLSVCVSSCSWRLLRFYPESRWVRSCLILMQSLILQKQTTTMMWRRIVLRSSSDVVVVVSTILPSSIEFSKLLFYKILSFGEKHCLEILLFLHTFIFPADLQRMTFPKSRK